MNPLMVPLMISNMAAGNVSIQLGLKGKCTNVVTACASGTNCIGDALRAIQYGDAEVMLAGGTESSITPTAIAGFTNLTALTTSTDPARASIPFDKDRSGFVLGEGAGVVVLEELEHALARNAHIYAELAGYGATGDAYHITSPCEDGSGAAKAHGICHERGRVKPEEVDYINAHGTSTHHNDLFETRAVKLAFGDAAKRSVYQFHQVHDWSPSGSSRWRRICHLCEIHRRQLYSSDGGNDRNGSGVRSELYLRDTSRKRTELCHDEFPGIWRTQCVISFEEIQRITDRKGAEHGY